MRIYKFSLLLFFFLSDATVAKTKKHALQVEIGSIVFGNYELSYEHRLSKRFSLSTAVNYYDSRAAIWRIYSRGYFIGSGFLPKIHIYGEAHKNSLYLAPSLKVGYLVHPAKDETEETDKGLLVRTGINFGYQHAFDFGLMMDTRFGLEHYYTFSFTEKPSRYQEQKLMIRPIASLSLGYAF